MKTSSQPHATNIQREFEGAALGDRRLEARLVALAERIRASPDHSFPDIMSTPAELTAFYRFLNNDAVSAALIVEPHLEQTARRCADAGSVVVIHDTTEAVFTGATRRQGLGRLRGEDDQGLLMHTALAAANNGSRRPLGVIGVHTWTRPVLGSSRDADGRKKSGAAYADDVNKESARWWKLIDETEDRLAGMDVIHVFDREGDAYGLLRAALDHEARFVTRMARDRVVLDEDGERIGRVSEVLVDIVGVLKVEVVLSPRAPKNTPRTTDPPRQARVAQLAVGATKMHLAAPAYMGRELDSLEVNVVYVHETGAPTGVEPIAWVLITSEPIDTPEQIRAVVEAYRLRWLIEEYFKALKTGCALEKRQLESYESITAAIALFLPVAWQLLLLRNLGRSEPEKPADLVLTPVQLDVLRAAVPALALPPMPSVAQALRAVAYLGGHYIKRDPGWLVLGRGLQKLLDLETGWRLGRGTEM
jgi:hypothetical protein